MTLSLLSYFISAYPFGRIVNNFKSFTFIFVVFLLTILNVNAQDVKPDSSKILQNYNSEVTQTDTVKKKPRVNYFGVRLGATLPYFNHAKGNPSGALSDNIFWNWHAGLSMDFFTRRYYNARIDVEYINKGAKETFTGDGLVIHTQNKLQYGQVTVMPIVIKPGFTKVNPYLGFGGYYAYQIGKKSYYTIDGGERQNDEVTNKLLTAKNDYGLCVSLGMYLKRKPLLEVRYAWGLADIMPAYGIKNRSLSLSISF